MKRSLFGILIALIVVGVAAAWFGGAFVTDRITPEKKSDFKTHNSEPAAVAFAVKTPVTQWYEAVGVVRPKLETSIESQVQATILDVLVRPGDTVTSGAPLIILDSRQLNARLEQAQEAVASAKSAKAQATQAISAAQARYDQTKADYGRMSTLVKSGAVTAQEVDKARSDFLQAQAALAQARDGVDMADAKVRQAEKSALDAKISLDYAVMKAPEDSQIVKRLAEPGDLAFPGKALLVLQTGSSLRLEAAVREGLIAKARVGERFPVTIEALADTEGGGKTTAVIEEVVPFADPKTRTFLVKVGLPALDGAYPGMFGRLFIPLGKRDAVLVPAKALRRIGQLDMVRVKEGDTWRDVAVRTGKTRDNMVEIVSGLNGGEELALFDTASPESASPGDGAQTASPQTTTETAEPAKEAQ
ncbi:efflux RND transporter periplasmic adaptor subunit [Desulfovibrio inopinatus]|uniref:efflux RND transporter periplasmic adaptor subunit n=1 Tax=Desulfovibrio inopinatus TaxID=102109 RepID=UPI000413A991|nr:efflux RND transporter periplasmic adaptor subunit [Desulfovibrio inopinatus]